MKKILLTSLLAMVMAVPAFAGTGANTNLNGDGVAALTATDGSKTPVGYVTISDGDKAAVATAAYVKGAYNALGGAIDSNAAEIEAQGNSIDGISGTIGNTILTTNAQTLTGAINELKGSITSVAGTEKEVAAIINWGDSTVGALDVTNVTSSGTGGSGEQGGNPEGN